jgi:sterol desaturase/sphingolipid hydroxylase (fatty acid hydroxylase superfamily)
MISFLIHFSSYWFFCGLFYFYDKKFILKSKENKYKYIDAIKTSLLNQIIYTLPMYYLINNRVEKLMLYCSGDSYKIILSKLFILLNLSNILFYMSHRLLHHDKIFKYIHYKHHKFIQTVAPASLYAHPIEHIICNNLCFLIPYLLTGFSRNITYGLLIFGSFNTTISHVEHKFIFSSLDHIYHHRFYKYNYGFGGYIDQIFRTYYDK